MSTESDEGFTRNIDSLIKFVKREPELKDKNTVIEGLKALKREIEAKSMSRAGYTSCTDFDYLDELDE